MVGWAAQNNKENQQSVKSIPTKGVCNSCRVHYNNSTEYTQNLDIITRLYDLGER